MRRRKLLDIVAFAFLFVGSATGNGVWATATGNGLWVTATGNGNLEAALLKHEGRRREATLGGNDYGNRQPRFRGTTC